MGTYKGFEIIENETIEELLEEMIDEFRHLDREDIAEEYKAKLEYIRKEKKKNNNRNIRILQHKISYYYHQDQKISEYEQEHIKEAIIEGYNQGELNDNGNRGWWYIVF